MSDAVAIFKCLGDKTRFDILCQLYRTDSYVELLASKLGLTAGTISFHLNKMEKVGLVKCSRTQFYIIYSINRELISGTIESFLAAEQGTTDNDNIYRQKVLDSFFDCGRLTRIPVQQKKREIVFEEILKNFEKGVDYPEKDVNTVINRYYADHCTLRRWLIDDGYMTRDHEVYRLVGE